MGLFPDTVTLYNRDGEVDRKATYRRTVLSGVRFDPVVGVMKDSVPSLFIQRPDGYTETLEEEGWTLQVGDLIVRGISEIEIPDDTVADLEAAHAVYRIVGFAPLSLGKRTSLDVSLS